LKSHGQRNWYAGWVGGLFASSEVAISHKQWQSDTNLKY